MDTEADPRCLAIASAVRIALEKRYPRRRSCKNLCSVSACAIVRLCRQLRIRADVMGGSYRPFPLIEKPEFGNPEHIAASRAEATIFPHAWIWHRRNYIDVTLTQFDPEAEKVAILNIGDVRYQGKLEPVEHTTEMLPFCGSSQKELDMLIRSAKAILANTRGPV